MHKREKATPIRHEITHAKGGFVVRHSYDNASAGESFQPPTEHVFTDHAAMMKHLHKMTGGSDSDGDE